MKRPQITIRLGAAHNSITVDGHVFDRSQMAKSDRSFVRNVVIDALVACGALTRPADRVVAHA